MFEYTSRMEENRDREQESIPEEVRERIMNVQSSLMAMGSLFL